MTTNKVHDPKNAECPQTKYKATRGATCGIICTCEKQQQAPQEPTPTSVTGDEWEEVKSEDHWLEVKDPDGWHSAIVRWDGCIHYTTYSNEPMSEDEENQDYLHICDIQSEIDRLYSLLQVARKHYKNHHYYETAFAKEPSVIEAQRTHIKQALLGRASKQLNDEAQYYGTDKHGLSLDDIINIINEELA